MIENKLRGLTEEVGGSEGKKEVKSILKKWNKTGTPSTINFWNFVYLR